VPGPTRSYKPHQQTEVLVLLQALNIILLIGPAVTASYLRISGPRKQVALLIGCLAGQEGRGGGTVEVHVGGLRGQGGNGVSVASGGDSSVLLVGGDVGRHLG
jgi:hypothetical protein